MIASIRTPLELAYAVPERFAQIAQLARAKHQQDDGQDDQ